MVLASLSTDGTGEAANVHDYPHQGGWVGLSGSSMSLSVNVDPSYGTKLTHREALRSGGGTNTNYATPLKV